MAAASSKALWYLTRGTGVIALLLLASSMLLGILERKRWQSPHWPRFVTAALHRYLSLLSVAFVAVHVTTTVVDGFAPIGWLDVVVPFRSNYRPIWLGLGAVASDLLIALVVTSVLRVRLGYHAWRVVHWVAYACWPVALVHGLGTGTDIRHDWALVLNGAGLVTIVGAISWRLAEGRDICSPTSGPDNVGRRRHFVIGASVASVILPIAIVAWLVAGPLQPGWARRAGTPTRAAVSIQAVAQGEPTPRQVNGLSVPTSTIAGSQTPPSSAAPPSAPATLPAATGLQGRITQGADGGGQIRLTIDMSLVAAPATRLVIVLYGTALTRGGLQMRASEVALGPVAGPAEYHGTVQALDGERLTVAVAGHGEEIALILRLTIRADLVDGTMIKDGAGA